MIPAVHLLRRRLDGRPFPRLAVPLALGSLAMLIAGLALAIAR